VARNVCKANALVVYEDLNVKNLVKNHCLAKSINDVAWAAFRQWLEYFAVKFGSWLLRFHLITHHKNAVIVVQ
jgi:putative transposase